MTFHDIINGPRVIAITQKLSRQSAYDAACIALAEALETDVWTFDGPLARNAEQTGLPVKLIGTDAFVSVLGGPPSALALLALPGKSE